MFKWSSKKANKPQGQLIPDPKNAKAYELGRETGKQFTTVIDQFIVFHARKMGEGMYSTYYNLISEIDFSDIPSAIESVRAHSVIFKEEMDQYRVNMKNSCISFLGKIWEAIQILEFEGEMGDYIDSQLNNIYYDIISRAVDRGSDLITMFEIMNADTGS